MTSPDQEARTLAREVLKLEKQARRAVRGTPVEPTLSEGANGRERTRGKQVERLGQAVEELAGLARTKRRYRGAANTALRAWKRSQSLRWRLALTARRVARAEASKAASAVLGREDAKQEAMIGLLDAARRFDPEDGTSFPTYARWWVRAALKRAQHEARMVRLPESAVKARRRLQDAMRERTEVGEPAPLEGVAAEVGVDPRRAAHLLQVEQPRSVEEPVAGHAELRTGDLLRDSAPAAPEQIEVQQRWHLAEQAMAEVLDDRSREILARRYGIGGREAETLASIAEDHGVTAQRIRQLQKRAERRVADYAAQHVH